MDTFQEKCSDLIINKCRCVNYERLTRIIDWSFRTLETSVALYGNLKSTIVCYLTATGVITEDPLLSFKKDISDIILDIHETHNEGRLVPPEVMEINAVLIQAETVVKNSTSRQELRKLMKALVLWAGDLKNVKEMDYDDFTFTMSNTKISTLNRKTSRLKEFTFS